jgi:hypothetical protein
MRPRWTRRKARAESVPHADYALIAALEHEFGMDGCKFPDAPCAKVLQKPPPHVREMLPGGHWIHLSQCWCRGTIDVSSMSGTGRKVIPVFNPANYKNIPTEWTP